MARAIGERVVLGYTSTSIEEARGNLYLIKSVLVIWKVRLRVK